MAQRPPKKRDPDEMPTLFSAVMANLGPGRTNEARRFNLEVVLGFLGFFSLMAVIALAAAELRGDDALGYALATAALLALTWLTWRTLKKAGGWSSGSRR